MNTFIKIVAASLTLVLIFGYSTNTRNAQSILFDMSSAIRNARQLEYTMQMKERVGEKMIESKVKVRLNTSPFQVYVYSHYPNKGAEILYNAGENDNKALVNPNGFPFFNISFSPFNAQLRKNKHHTIMSMGFGLVGEIIADAVKAKSGSFDTYFRYTGEIIWDGKPCYRIELNDTDFKYIEYTLDRDETLYSLAKRKKISEHLIQEKNGISGYGTHKKGTTLLIPTSYALKTELYIEQKSMLPLVQIMYDDLGLFERYEYYELVLNPAFNASAFSRENSEYSF